MPMGDQLTLLGQDSSLVARLLAPQELPAADSVHLVYYGRRFVHLEDLVYEETLVIHEAIGTRPLDVSEAMVLEATL